MFILSTNRWLREEGRVGRGYMFRAARRPRGTLVPVRSLIIGDNAVELTRANL